jgi:hypothetical protein
MNRRPRLVLAFALVLLSQAPRADTLRTHR